MLNGSVMVLPDVLQCSAHGLCSLCIGSLIIMTVWQIALSAVQRIILLLSGEVRERSAEVLLVSSLLKSLIRLHLVAKCACFAHRSPKSWKNAPKGQNNLSNVKSPNGTSVV